MNRTTLTTACTFTLLLFSFALVSGCTSTTVIKKTVPQKKKAPAVTVPQWVSSVPGDENFVYAVGFSGATRNPENAIRQSGDNARVELAKIVAAYVVSQLRKQTELKDNHEQTIVEEMIYTFTHAELYGVEVIEHWLDNEATVAAERGTVFSLARMPKKNQVKIIADYGKQLGL